MTSTLTLMDRKPSFVLPFPFLENIISAWVVGQFEEDGTQQKLLTP